MHMILVASLPSAQNTAQNGGIVYELYIARGRGISCEVLDFGFRVAPGRLFPQLAIFSDKTSGQPLCKLAVVRDPVFQRLRSLGPLIKDVGVDPIHPWAVMIFFFCPL